MSIKEDIIEVLEALNPQIDETKATLERDIDAKSFSMLLKEPYGVCIIDHISRNLKKGKKDIFSVNRQLGRTEIESWIEFFYTQDRQEVLDFLLPVYHQFFLSAGKDPILSFEFFDKLESDVNIEKDRMINICRNCKSSSNGDLERCDQCNSDEIIIISKYQLPNTITKIIKNNQYLEIYCKHCLSESGSKPVGWNDKNGKTVFNSIKYQVDGEPIEIDVLSITNPIGLFLCECKTSEKIKLNELRKVDDVNNRLISKVNNLLHGTKVSIRKIFIITGEFDENIPFYSYRKRDWEFIDNRNIHNLSSEMKNIIKGL